MKKKLHYQSPKIEELVFLSCSNLSTTLSAPSELEIDHLDVDAVEVWQ